MELPDVQRLSLLRDTLRDRVDPLLRYLLHANSKPGSVDTTEQQPERQIPPLPKQGYVLCEPFQKSYQDMTLTQPAKSLLRNQHNALGLTPNIMFTKTAAFCFGKGLISV